MERCECFDSAAWTISYERSAENVHRRVSRVSSDFVSDVHPKFGSRGLAFMNGFGPIMVSRHLDVDQGIRAPSCTEPEERTDRRQWNSDGVIREYGLCSKRC